MLLPHTFSIHPGQNAKIRKALKLGKGCRIQVVKKGSSGQGQQQQLLVTPAHIEKYRKASHGSIVSLPFKHEDLKKNHRGGFLPLIAAALAPIIGGVAGGLIEKEISGSGIRTSRGRGRGGGRVNGSGLTVFRGKPVWRGPKLYTVEKHGSGMILNPWMGSPVNK